MIPVSIHDRLLTICKSHTKNQFPRNFSIIKIQKNRNVNSNSAGVCKGVCWWVNTIISEKA